jgi:hypothetical protein
MPRQVEGVELVSSRVVLRLEQRVEIPERREDEVAFDFREAHAQEDPPDLLDVGAQDVTLPRVDERGERLRVVPTEVDLAPSTGPQEVRRRLGDLFLEFDSGGEDLLARRGQADLSLRGLPFLHELPTGLQFAEDLRIDRLFRELSLREAGEQELVG